ncbi:MAG: hypothetical protein EON52_23860 [Actinomycetales bacterium]|nr:MAG: hypothetical protein EON52_23860 [Actinomycetales bacterium]
MARTGDNEIIASNALTLREPQSSAKRWCGDGSHSAERCTNAGRTVTFRSFMQVSGTTEGVVVAMLERAVVIW